jgi:hypothetical protein
VRMLYSSIMPYRVSSCPPEKTPAIGILSSTLWNPGRDLDGKGVKRPEHLLTDDILRRDLKDLRDGQRTEFYVFALNGIEEVRRLQKTWETL